MFWWFGAEAEGLRSLDGNVRPMVTWSEWGWRSEVVFGVSGGGGSEVPEELYLFAMLGVSVVDLRSG